MDIHDILRKHSRPKLDYVKEHNATPPPLKAVVAEPALTTAGKHLLLERAQLERIGRPRFRPEHKKRELQK